MVVTFLIEIFNLHTTKNTIKNGKFKYSICSVQAASRAYPF